MTLNMIMFLTALMLIMAILTAVGLLAGGVILTLVFLALFCVGGYLGYLEWTAKNGNEGE
jgi:hypothetical protein